MPDREALPAPGEAAQPRDVAADVVDRRLAVLDEADQPPEVHPRGEQQRPARPAVAPAAAGLLVVGLEARRQRPVRDRAHVRLVDAHPERVRRDDHLGGPRHERLLRLVAASRRHPGVVGDDPHRQRAGELLRERLRVAPRPAVDDRRQRPGAAEHVQQRRPLARERALALEAGDVEHQVLAVEPRAHPHRLAQPEAALDLPGDLHRRGRRRRHHRGPAERVDRLAEAQVVRPEVVPPLGDAVRLVDDEQPDPARVQGATERRGGEALRRGEHELCVAGLDRAQRLGVVAVGHPRGEHRGPHAARLQPPALVGHQRDQRADDDHQRALRGLSPGGGGKLVAERLAAARRHHDQRVAAVERRLDRLALPRPEAGQPEPGEQRLGLRPRRGGALCGRCAHPPDGTRDPGRQPPAIRARRVARQRPAAARPCVAPAAGTAISSRPRALLSTRRPRPAPLRLSTSAPTRPRARRPSAPA